MKFAKRLCMLLAAAVLLLALAGCKEMAVDLVHKVMGTSNQVEEEDTTRWAEATSDPIMVPEGTDTTVKYTNIVSNGSLFAIYNGIWSRDTGYFTVPSGTLTITACGTAEGTQKYKIALWRKVDGGAEYVDGSTGYIKTDGANYCYTITGLDPAASYRITVSYDSSMYYLYGMFQAEGIAA